MNPLKFTEPRRAKKGKIPWTAPSRSMGKRKYNIGTGHTGNSKNRKHNEHLCHTTQLGGDKGPKGKKIAVISNGKTLRQ
jgi:hypothetical protein